MSSFVVSRTLPQIGIRIIRLFLVASLLLLLTGTLVAQGPLTLFDAPDAGKAVDQGTVPTSINSKGVIAGYYIDSSNLLHGFLRQANGQITEFSPPNMSDVFVVGINSSNQIVGIGNRMVSTGSETDGFLRSPAGHLTLIKPAGATLTQPWQINDSGSIVGSFQDSAGMHGFIRDSSGNYTVVDDPDAQIGLGSGTWALAINANGAVTGYYDDTHTAGIRAFVRDQFGNYTNFDVISDPIQAVVPTAINASGEVAGYYADFGYAIHSFLRDASGTVTFDVTNGNSTESFGMNDSGAIAGCYFNTRGVLLGFHRDAAGNYLSISGPAGNTGTEALAINNTGHMTGLYLDKNSAVHGWVK
jgi:hypothetical protein